MNAVRMLKAAGAVSVVAMLAACSADPTQPVAIRPSTPSLDFTSTPPATPGARPQAGLSICKNTTNTIIADVFTYSVDVRYDVGGAPVKTVSNIQVTAGTCVDAQLGLTADGPDYRVDVTETVPQYYSISGITAQWGIANAQSAPTIDPTATPQVTNLFVGHDIGSTVTFTNLYTPPTTGCTLTQGYWKTHNASFKGGAKPDPTWALLGASAELTTFYLSGNTWFGVFNTAPAGNVYYNLAHQFMAASLNQLSGASVPGPVATAISDATTLFNTYTPAQVAALKGSSTVRAQFVTLAGVLGAYNEGKTGPGHCE